MAVWQELGRRDLGSKVAHWTLPPSQTCWRGAALSSQGGTRNSSQPMTDGDRSWDDWLVAKTGRGQHRPQDPELRGFLGVPVQAG